VLLPLGSAALQRRDQTGSWECGFSRWGRTRRLRLRRCNQAQPQVPAPPSPAL